MKVKKAIIPAAGFGTRFLPATKSCAKEMLPIVNIPTIQHIVEEAVNSGIEEILIIVSNSKNSIIDHFDRSRELEAYLLDRNKKEYYDLVHKISNLAKIYFIRQKEPKGLGDAIMCGRSFIQKNEPFAVLLGDDVIFNNPKKPLALKQCIDVYEKTKKNVLGVQEVERKNVSKYGIIKPQIKNGIINVKTIIEKPSEKKAPSNYAVLGRYILTPDIFRALEKTKMDKSKELQLTDAIEKLTKLNKVVACNFVGKRYDIGSKEGFVKATIDQALKDPEISLAIKNHISSIIKK